MKSISGAALVQQTVTAGGSSMVRDVTQYAEVHQLLPIYFHLDIWDPEQDASGFNTQPVRQLEPGRRYIVTVETRFEGSPTQNYVYVRSSLALYLRVQETAFANAITITSPETTLVHDGVEGYEYEFELETAPELPHGQATLELQYLRPVKRSKPETAVTLRIPLAGTYNPVDPKLLEACHINLAVERPSQTAIIHVEHAGTTGQVRLTCWGYYANRTLQTAPFTPPNVCLADFIEAQEDPLTVLGKLRTFSSDHPDLELIAWINLLHKRLGEVMQLVIMDHTDTEIPWEMLELKDGVYLGAMVPIARWLPVPYYEKHIPMQVKREKRIGRVMAYLDEQELPHAVKERQILNHFMAHFQPGVQELYKGFKESLAEIGLVYLACHGIFASDTELVAYGSWHNPSKRLIPLQLELLPYHESERPILFVNACHSARVKRYGQKLHGLPVVMLKRVASGYIGTLGPVSSGYASEIAVTVLTAIRNAGEGAQPAELLRLIRSLAAKQLHANEKSQADQLRFIYTFMYIFYGNPLTHLQLLPAAVKGEGDE